MDISAIAAKFFLSFSNDIILVPLIITGFICLDKRKYGQAFMLLLFTMIFARILKEYFQIPLNPALGVGGFAFPSGHMQSAVVFYGWLYIFSSRLARMLIILLLCGIGFGLIQQGYHNIADVAAAVGFGVITIAIFYNFSKLEFIDEYPYLMGWVMIPVAFTMMFYSRWCITHIPSHLWLAFYALIGFTVSWTIFYNKLNHPLKTSEKISSLILAFATIGGIYYLIPTFKNMFPSYLQLEWLLAGFIIPASVAIVKYLYKIKNA